MDLTTYVKGLKYWNFEAKNDDEHWHMVCEAVDTGTVDKKVLLNLLNGYVLLLKNQKFK